MEQNLKKAVLERECIECIKMIYRQHAAGGLLHIVLDDGNTEDDYLEFCVQSVARAVNSADGDPRDIWLHCIEMACAMLLVEMSEDERNTTIAKAKEEMYGTAES